MPEGCAGEERDTALQEFYKTWRKDGLVVNKWLMLLAGSNVPGNLEAVKDLTKHKAFNIRNPSSCYSLFLSFTRSLPNFHAEDGSGYRFLADTILNVSASLEARRPGCSCNVIAVTG